LDYFRPVLSEKIFSVAGRRELTGLLKPGRRRADRWAMYVIMVYYRLITRQSAAENGKIKSPGRVGTVILSGE
jgi:hypothetical protein